MVRVKASYCLSGADGDIPFVPSSAVFSRPTQDGLDHCGLSTFCFHPLPVEVSGLSSGCVHPISRMIDSASPKYIRIAIQYSGDVSPD